VDSVDRRLDLVGPGTVAPQTSPDELVPLSDEAAIPSAAIVLGQGNERALRGGAGVGAGLFEEHQCHLPFGLGLARHELDEQPAEPDGLAGELVAHQPSTGAGGVALVKTR
jgi:hypothetical protein